MEPQNCEYCGIQFEPTRKGQKYHKAECRFDAANRRKSEPRQLALAAQGGRCAYPDCVEEARRFYADLWPDRRPGGHVLCDFHSAEYCKYKRHEKSGLSELEELIRESEKEQSREDNGIFNVRSGRYYYGFWHISLDDPAFEAEARHDPIGQLIDHLSGTCDDQGVLIPHPLDCVVMAA